MKRLINKLVSYFLQGIIIVVPLAAVVFTVTYVYNLLTFYQILGHAWLTILVIVLGVFVVGLLARTFLQPLFLLFEDLLSKAPVFKFVYTSIKDLMEAFVGEKKRFNQPVLLNLVHETHLQRFGFVTQDDLSKLGPDLTGKVAVYIPMSYSVSGNLYIVPAHLLTPLPQVDAAELMKYILSGGVTDLEDLLRDPAKTKPAQPDLKEDELLDL